MTNTRQSRWRTLLPAVLIAAAWSGAAEGGPKPGLRLKSAKQINFPCTLRDGAGYTWDIQLYGTIGQGTNRAYSGGLYLQVNGTRVRSTGRGRMNADGDEIELGPYQKGNLRVYRRIKVYKDRGLARWVDVFENPGSQKVTVSVRLWSDMITTIGQTTYSSGKARFSGDDCAFVTTCRYPNAPSLFHYVCSPRSKLRPSVIVQSDDIYVNFKFTVPAKDAVALCCFESQHRSAPELTKLMKSFRPYDALKDLPSALRRRLLNMPSRSGFGGVELERSESRDLARNKHGDPIFGTIANESFQLETLFGPMTIPAAKVVGMASAGGEGRRFRALLTGGQIVAGQLAADARLELKLPTGGDLRVPFTDLQQFAYRISEQRPDEVEFAGPLMALRTGDRVAFEPGSVKLKFRTRHGMVDLRPDAMLSVELDQESNGVHRATFLNGSQLAGFLEPERIPLKLKLGPELTISRNLVYSIRFAAEEKSDPTLDAVVLSNGDEMFGRLAEGDFALKTRYGQLKLRPENIQAMAFSNTHLGRVALRLWNGSVLRGQCGAETLAFQIAPGPTVEVYVGQFVQVRRSQALPPKEVRQRVAKLVAQLGAESYKDRQAATKELVKMGKGIIPMLKKRLSADDPEVRQRIADVLEQLGAARPTGATSPAANVNRNGVQLLIRD